MLNNSQKNETKKPLNEPLAIIGMNCQFPGLDSDIEDVDAFYKMLVNGQTPIKDVPKNRWDIDEHYDANRNTADKMISRKGGFLSHVDLFDAGFFKVSSTEAKQIDPQHRLFLEVSIRALNHANITLDSLSGSNTGVFCGISTHDYSELNHKDDVTFSGFTQLGVASSAAAGRLCHFLNLQGPSMAVDTACASSMSALYLAATSLRTAQCNMAIVGGVHLGLCPESLIGFTKANMLSAVGKCHSFDIAADGFVSSEGCGVVIVKRLSDAIKDNDTVHAVIKSIIMNHNGEGVSLAAPNVKAQIAMHYATLEQAQMRPSDIDYIESHGSGTRVGDSVEFNAIRSVHQGYHSNEKPLVIGALKSSLGHTITSSGIASLIKAICTLQHDLIPPNLNYSTPSDLISPDTIPAILPVASIPFRREDGKKRAVQILNFSFSGANVSAIIEEPPKRQLRVSAVSGNDCQCVLISAKTELSLKQQMLRFLQYLKISTDNLNDICSTLINCRDHYKFRCAIMVHDKETLIKKIELQEYEFKKVVAQKETKIIRGTPNQIVESYLAGDNIRTEINDTQYNKVDLPLYCFDRRSYWHEKKKKTSFFDKDGAFLQQTQEQQLETIKAIVLTQIRILLKKEDLEENHDFESLGFNEPLLEELEHGLFNLFSRRFHLKFLPLLTIDELARHIQQSMVPITESCQPSINVLSVEPIAIIGMGCRFPKAENIDAFLTLLTSGDSGMTDIPLERWDNEKYYDANPETPGRLCIKQLGFIDNIKDFDAEFFNISPREAKLMAPQLRVFMETSFHALEDANLCLDLVKGSNTGVFVGVGTNEYPQVLAMEGVNLDELNIYFATGNVLNALPGRVAYAFDFHGPIQAIDTACSSSMTAIHNACLSLQSGDCNMALAGGVNILLTPETNITLSKARMLSPDSRCKTFSDDADGYARSEGCGVIVLKRLSTALQDNDNVLAVIKGAAVNSDGRSSGFTVPNGTAQEEVIRSALAKSKLSPSDIDYIEVHGTGTPVADPIEVNTLTRVFGKYHTKDRPLYISSVKTNIGHSESASGVAGIIKAVLSLQNQTIFKHLNFKKLNPEIVLENTVIPLNNTVWQRDEGLRAAGVSSFGFSGANAHVILQEALRAPKKEERTLPKVSLLVLSAKSKAALEILLLSYRKYLLNTVNEFADICFTAATCRSHFLFRVAIKASTSKEAAAIIEKNQYSIYPIKNPRELSQKPQNLEQLQFAYQEGFIIDWTEFYQAFENTFEKVRLPLYGFVRDEHWYGNKEKLKDAPVPKDWCFQLQWECYSVQKYNVKQYGRNWLMIGGTHLRSGLVAQGLQIILEDDDYSSDQLDGIIFSAGLGQMSLTDIDATIDFQKESIKKLLNLVKKFQQKAIQLPLVVVTSNGIPELAVGQINLSHSPLIGFCKTLALELPQFHTILIDLDQPGNIDSAAYVMNEIAHNHGQFYEHLIAYREGKRFGVRLKKTTLVKKWQDLHGAGRYLITGGCGGLGLITAQALLSAGARELTLTSRQVDKPSVKIAIKKIQSFYPGRIIRVVSVDVTDKEALGRLIIEMNDDGLLKGIIHAAGAAIKAPIIEHQEDDVDYLFEAKVKGGWYLHELSQDCSLDFFVVYSSISSVFGSNKESVYTATNSFLDALMTERRRMGLVGTAVQWGPWGEVGMASARSRDQGLRQALINNEQGHGLIKALINSQMSQVAIISPGFLEFMLDFVPRPMPAFHQTLADDLSKVEPSCNSDLSPWLNDFLDVSADKRLTACKDMLSAICKTILELSPVDELDEDEGFFELGFDSLMITEMASDLKEKLSPTLKVTVNLGFDYPTINKLSKYIESELDKNLITKRMTASTSKATDDSIAIIGMSCSLPNAPNLAAFETLLEDGLSGIRDIPFDRWDNSKYFDQDINAPRKSYVNKLGLIDNIKLFDANFFGISPREAKLMEPQQRIFLESCYKALENANYPSESLRGSLTGVFAGVGPNEYYAQLEKAGFSDEELSVYSITGNVLNLIPGRVAYTFDFKGPSIALDTACSSSLVAIHYACQSLKNREVDYALAGGVNILLMPESNVTLCKARALSPDGQCKTFDEKANGYVRAEGCGVIFLKRTSDAIRDKDTILAVIKASAINNDGRSAGLTVPNGKSQEDVMKKALSQTELSPSDIGYIEAHGTGTPLGDPIEAHAINAVYGAQRHLDNPLYMGTVKTNIGHLESAAGVAAIIKTVISLQKKKIYKHLNFNQLNPAIELHDTRIALKNTSWNTREKLHCAGVNAFGFSGTNAHVILQEYLNDSGPYLPKSVKAQLLVFSAKSKNSLDKLANRYQHYLETTPHDFSDICFTAATARIHYPYRLALIAESATEASRCLESGYFALSDGKNNIDDLQKNPVLKTLVKDYLQGEQVGWVSYYKSSGETLRKVALPNYTFDRLEYWPDKRSDVNSGELTLQDLLNASSEETQVPKTEVQDQILFNPDSVKNTHPAELTFLNALKQYTQEERVTVLGQALCEITAKVLELDNIERITVTDNLFSMGLDSLMSLEIRHRIHDKIHCEALSISIEYFINDPSIDKIARHIADELRGIFGNTTIQHPTDNEDEVALCDFQYIFWALHKLDYSFNIGMQLRLDGKLNKEHVFQAFDFVVKQNSVFWIEFDKNTPIQRWCNDGQFNLIYEDLTLEDEACDLNAAFYHHIKSIIPLRQQPLIRVCLYKINNEEHELHLVIPHIIADDTSCEIVFSQFKTAYEALVFGKKPIPVLAKDTYFNYVRLNNRHYEKNIEDKVDFWRDYNKDFGLLYFGQEHHLVDAAVYQHRYLCHYKLPSDLIDPFLNWHKVKNINVSSGLIAACQMAFHKISSQNKVPIILLHSGREGSQFKSIVGSFPEYKRINLTLNEEDKFIDCIKSIEEQLFITAPYQKCSRFIKDSGLKGAGWSISQYLSSLWTKLSLKRYFKASKLHSTIIDYYLEFLGNLAASKYSTVTKHYLNHLFKLNMPLQGAGRLHTIISITHGFFIKEPQELHFAGIDYSFSSHMGCLDRPIGSDALWIYFSRNECGEYLLSINGPLTQACKDQIASNINTVISEVVGSNVDKKFAVKLAADEPENSS